MDSLNHFFRQFCNGERLTEMHKSPFTSPFLVVKVNLCMDQYSKTVPK